MGRGIIFSVDVLLASFILGSGLFLIYYSFSGIALGISAEAKDAEKSLFAVALSDAVIKAGNPENPAAGSAYFDAEKNRFMPNAVDAGLLRRIRERDFGKMRLAAVYERFPNSAKKFFFGKITGGCIAVERFVVFMGEYGGRKGILGVVVCGG
ncbi:MAG TPA: hypothetical protein VFF09_01365 [archaeon]|nr:hypothetical protein [archaeon]